MKNSVALRFASISALVAGVSSSAMAALPTEAATEIATFKTDALSAGGMIIGAGIAVWGLIKLGRKFGWF